MNYQYRKPGKENLLRCTYVLPDGVTHTKGFVKDPEAAQRYLKGADESQPKPSETKMDIDQHNTPVQFHDKKNIDLTKNVLILYLLEQACLLSLLTHLFFSICTGI